MEHYLEGHSTSPRVMIPATRAFHQTARSGAHGFRSHRLRPLLMLCKYCRIRVNSESEKGVPTRVFDSRRVKMRKPSLLVTVALSTGLAITIGAYPRLSQAQE